MFEVNTNLYARNVENQFRLNNLKFAEKSERLSSGSRVNRGADDPSGLGIATSMGAQIRGMDTAIGNIQEGIRFLRLTDDFLDDVQSSLFRMRDLTLKLSNEAVNDARPGANQSDRDYGSAMETYKEILNIGDHIFKSIRNYNDNFEPAEPRMNYNTKQIFQGEYNPPDGQVLQVGPDDNVNHTVKTIIDDLTPVLQGVPVPYDDASSIDGRMNAHDYMVFGQDLLQKMDGKIDFISDVRERIGVQDSNLQHTVKDLIAQKTNMLASKSRIIDADFANEMSQYTKELILQKSTDAAAAQANAAPASVSKLLGAIYDGMRTGFFSGGGSSASLSVGL